MFTDDRCYQIAREIHHCPHCSTRLSCCRTPPFHVGDGLGWGSEIFFVCLNDEYRIFENSWGEFVERYGKAASCRYMLLPNEEKGGPMMVGSKDAFTGMVVDPDEVAKGNERYRREQEAVARLDCCVAEKDLAPVLCLIIDEEANLANRQRACDLLEGLDDLACIDPIRGHKFLHTEIGQQADLAIGRILKNQNRMECTHCAEIIKAHAKVCKSCGRETGK
jgi:hypothetical protein